MAPKPEATPEVEAPLDEPIPSLRTLAAPVPATASALSTLAAPTITFTDVSSRVGSASYTHFTKEIAWLAQSGVTRGWLLDNGKREFRPTASVARDAMAAFLYRYAGQPAHYAPSRSPFLDISSRTAFYREITWASESGISTGWKVSGGHDYRSQSAITREAMAAFLYRFAGSPKVTLPSRSPFRDVPTSSQFYKQIVWLAQTGVSTGWRTDRGAEFRPDESISREAMAAFLYRLDRAGIGYSPAGTVGPLLRHSTLYVYGASTLNVRSGPSTGNAVVTRLSSGTAVTPTGKVSSGGWIEIVVDGARVWASGHYLAGGDGAAVSRIKATYSNGVIPTSHLCALSWDKAELLLCSAAADLERLNSTFKSRYGRNIPINDAYRTYDEQVAARVVHGNLAAIPGTSNHGWAAAIDIAGASLPGGYDGAAYQWLLQQLTGYNWKLPTWARPGGSKPEPWHFEYTG
ncbi:SH3 domain-containing protein [Demequina sp. NBRC 110056]|uniref:SH3 domain-containing protein n=1 Tax=Demequina sp. NBRC 110056 TaxID=1570345 RepID=UPI00117E8FE6|nr:SH3 domain-containing protein [Demequina sp. NBRC 110056]